MATVTGMTAAKILELVGKRVSNEAITREVVLSNLAANASVNASALFGKAYRLDKVTATKPCRLRLYSTTLHRTADADRERTKDPTGDHGLIAEVILTADFLTLVLCPPPHGYTESGTTYMTVTNDGTTGDITLTFLGQTLEP